MPGSADAHPAHNRGSLPPGVLPSEEMVNGLYGPGLMDEAEALAAAIVATIDQMQLRVMVKPPSPASNS
ncbi:hypothetical protein [Mesorhizobium caraganae]|uniref:hypothetical protein n=1 Tax=Mesorhizobium caraganae TaxID=483206 RepID=UPI001FE82A49|nr:hypothetical protein [Mesorhizobium caraganae]